MTPVQQRSEAETGRARPDRRQGSRSAGEPAGRPRIFWLMRGSHEVASSRIHGYRIHSYLRREGWSSHILVEPRHWLTDSPLTASDLDQMRLLGPGDVVVCQKFEGPNARGVLRALAEQGVRTVFLDSDLPVKLEEGALASRVICSSRFLAEEYARQGVEGARCIPDAFEHSDPPLIRPGAGRKLRCVWFGVINETSKKWKAIEYVQRILADERLRNWELVTITRTDRAHIQWNLEEAWRHIREGDAVVLPSSVEPWERAKSSNRATQAMALGLPVVAAPIPAYEEVIESGRNGFLCYLDEDWTEALSVLSDDSVRRRIAEAGYRYSTRHFSIEAVGRLWEQLFYELATPGEIWAPRTAGQSESLTVRRTRARAFARMAAGVGRRSVKLFVRYSALGLREWPFEGAVYGNAWRRATSAAVRGPLRLLKLVRSEGSAF